MTQALHKSRRQFVGIAIASLGLAAIAGDEAARAVSAPQIVTQPLTLPPLPGLAPEAPSASANAAIVAAASDALTRKGSLIPRHDVVAVADFSQPSKSPRLHLVDMGTSQVESLLVAHGRGSDPHHTGWLSTFSNAINSDATAQGDYVTGEYYVGEHGRSMRLTGLDPSNDNAKTRDIVVHAAWYVSPKIVETHGMVGCSEGCFAVDPSDLPHVLQRLGPGRLLVSTKL